MNIAHDELRVGIAGDWHGSLRWAERSIPLFKRAGVRTIFHLGDFGIWHGAEGRMFLRGVDFWCSRAGITIFVTPGNHENYDEVDAIPVAEDGLQWATEHVALLPRGHRWRTGGRNGCHSAGRPASTSSSG